MERVCWTLEADEELRKAAESGLSARQIEIQGRTYKSIQSRMHMLGLRPCLARKVKGYALRKCLKCDRSFGSEHVGNRICLPCKQADERVSSYVRAAQ
jgi:hypothetical protein